MQFPPPCFQTSMTLAATLPFGGTRIFLILFLALNFMYSVQAQRDPRIDVGDLSPQESDDLAGLIDTWLDNHTDILSLHFTHFGPIHSLPNFFPWHRAHIRELEDALFPVPPNPTPYILPRWRPRASAGEPDNEMPEAMQFTNGTPQIHGMPNPNPLVPILSTIDLPAANCLSVDEFSSIVQGDYHDLVHSAVGGEFLEQSTSATVIGFWPWHAWVDEFWYNWEKHCTVGYDYFPATGSTEIIINSQVTWSGERYVKGKVIIESGGRLDIAPGAVIHFRSSDYESYETSILVKPGGVLYVDAGAKLTGIDRLGSNVGGAGGIQYNSGWKGIRVEGAGTFSNSHGRVYVRNDAVIEHASIGIESVGGGRIIATNADFLNNRISIRVRDFNHPMLYHYFIQGCDFDVTTELRDVTWTPDMAQAALPKLHFRHFVPETPERHILLENVRGVHVFGGTFGKSLSKPGETTTGIEAVNARFSCVDEATFASSLDLGIAVLNTVSGPVGDPYISTCIFNSREGILLNGADYVTISANTFNNTVSSIEARASSAYDIFDNVINGGPAAVSVLSDASAGNHANIIERNIFSGSDRQLQFQFGNSNVQFRCNNFNSPVTYSVVLFNGSLPDQGNCDMEKPAGNQWDDCVGTESQLFKTTIAPGYKYETHNDRLPICYSLGIVTLPCSYSYEEDPNNSCEVSPPCPTCPPYPEQPRIAGLEAEKQTWASSALPPEEIAAIIWQLTWEQKIIAQRGLLRVIEADSTLATALDYIDDVGAVFPFPTSDRIGLYLSSNNLSAANSLIAALPSGNEKTLFALFSTLKSEVRSFKQITPAEEQTVRAIAQGSDQSASQAKSILYAAFGEKITIEPEPVGGGGKPASETVKTQTPATDMPTITFVPNPGSEVTAVRYSLNSIGPRMVFTLTNIFGRQVVSQQFFSDNLAGELTLDLHDLPAGTYIGTIAINGQRQAVSKLTIVK
ncbi:MAG: hypothetical protein DYG98_01855 [Haliscomenobacteraceae bacterium CHB4]|nr:hypothetical protein [Haliscomenobacteraceae bacterium CHB4]